MNTDTTLRTAGNGVTVDIGRPSYDPDNTIIHDKLKIIEFAGGFSTSQGGENYAKAFGVDTFTRAVDDAVESIEQSFGLSKEQGLKIIDEVGQLDTLRTFNNGLFEFLQGIAAQTGIPVEEIVLALVS